MKILGIILVVISTSYGVYAMINNKKPLGFDYWLMAVSNCIGVILIMVSPN